MRLGVVLPTFATDARAAFAAAAEAEAAGLDGVFCYDHLWPLGEPGRPALAPFPVLGALATRTERIALGTLVARVGLVPDAVLRDQFATLAELVGPRLIAGLGTGDHLSAPENDAYGLPLASAAERRERVGAVADALIAAGVTTWIGGRSAGTLALARAHGAVPNLWAAPPEEVRAVASAGEVTWGGALGTDAGARLAALAAAGATYIVVAWPGSTAPLLAAAAAAGLRSAA